MTAHAEARSDRTTGDTGSQTRRRRALDARVLAGPRRLSFEHAGLIDRTSFTISGGVLTFSHEAGLPKSGKPRIIPMTERLAEALRGRRGVGRGRVVCCSDGSPLDRDRLKRLMAEAQRGAGLKADGRVHVLRHTFGARLAMSGAPPKAIQELMGHADLTTTLRYMHLTPQATTEAIRRLDQARGDVGETKKAPAPNT